MDPAVLKEFLKRISPIISGLSQSLDRFIDFDPNAENQKVFREQADSGLNVSGQLDELILKLATKYMTDDEILDCLNKIAQ